MTGDGRQGESVDGEERLTYETWADALRDGRLLGQECGACGHTAGVPKSACPACSSRDLSAVELPESGTVFSETDIEVTPPGHDDEYRVGIVDLGPTRVLARLEGAPEIGDPVEFVHALVHDDMPGPVFE